MNRHKVSPWFHMALSCLAVAVLLLLSTPRAARADLTYNYVGNPFTQIQGTQLGTSVTATVTFDNITANYTGIVSGADIPYWSITAVGSGTTFDINTTGAETDVLQYNQLWFTFVNGQMTYWKLVVAPPGGGINGDQCIGTMLYQTTMGLYGEDLSESWYSTYLHVNKNGGQEVDNGFITDPGTWTCSNGSPVPEPCTPLLAVSCLAGFAVFRMKFRAA